MGDLISRFPKDRHEFLEDLGFLESGHVFHGDVVWGRFPDKTPELQKQRPVSYTHLDVYKRQLDELGEELAALGVDGGLLVLGGRPLGMT